MTTSGTSAFNLSTSSCILEAFDRCEVRPSEITREQLTSAIRSFNLELSTWNSNPVNLWCVDLITIPVVDGQSTYVLDPKYQLVVDAYASLTQSGNTPIDRILISVSRDEYASYPNKIQEAAPTVFWFQRLETPQITLWPIPTTSTITSLCVYAMRRVQDVTTTGSQTVDVPYRFLEPAIAKLAARLAMKYKPEKFPLLKAEAKEQYDTAFFEDHERTAFIIQPDFGPYYND